MEDAVYIMNTRADPEFPWNLACMLNHCPIKSAPRSQHLFKQCRAA